ncbi:uncharacterized protein B4U80_08351 [Leptotrombidium deliense]|uniref:RING-type domain-containing protein n=1 Tax=Leptotrombidium deliense TaxID=299467 RepID=A0A443SQ05_9ACAR|nr:uncharacterized protein B4U80_08351 [Leptotrombidium deliense]
MTSAQQHIWTTDVPFTSIPDPCDFQSKERQPIENEEECSICLDTTDEDMCRTIRCDHWLHETCLMEWMKRNDSCPLCRSRSNTITYKDGRLRFVFREYEPPKVDGESLLESLFGLRLQINHYSSPNEIEYGTDSSYGAELGSDNGEAESYIGTDSEYNLESDDDSDDEGVLYIYP